MKKSAVLFCLLVFQFHLYSQVSTVRQVFNFSVGDTFEYSYNYYDVPAGQYNGSGYILDVITSMQQSGDSIYYGYSSYTTTTAFPAFGPDQGSVGPFQGWSGSDGCAILGFLQSSGSSIGSFAVYDLDSSIFSYSYFRVQCDTPRCGTSTAITSAYHGRKQSIFAMPTGLTTINETYVDGIGLVNRNDYLENTPSTELKDTLIYYSKAGTGERWGQLVVPQMANVIGGSVAKNGAVCATVYLIVQDTIGHLSAWDSVNIPCTTAGSYQFNNMPADTYYIKAALTTNDTDYANYLPTYYGDSLHWAGAKPIVFPPNGTWSQYPVDIAMIAGTNPGGPGFAGGWVIQGAGLVTGGNDNYSRSVGSPLGNVQINLLAISNLAVAYTYTDANGHYSFNNLTYGSYMLYAEELNKTPVPVYFTLSPQNPADSNVNISINSHIATGMANPDNRITCNVFPNPVSDDFTFFISKIPAHPSNLKIYDVTGREIKAIGIHSLKTNISCSDIPSGVYCWQLESAGSVVSRGKLVLR